MGFIETVIAVALGVALGPYVIPLLEEIINRVARILAPVLLLALAITLIQALYLIGRWFGLWEEGIVSAALAVGEVAVGLLLFAGLSWVIGVFRSGLDKIRDHGKTLLRIRITSVGAVLLWCAATYMLGGFSGFMENGSVTINWLIVLLLALAYTVFAGVSLSKADILWQENITVLVGVALTSFLVLAASALVLGLFLVGEFWWAFGVLVFFGVVYGNLTDVTPPGLEDGN